MSVYTNFDAVTEDEIEDLIKEFHLSILTISSYEKTLQSFVKQMDDNKFIQESRSQFNNTNSTTSNINSKSTSTLSVTNLAEDLGIRLILHINDILSSYPPILKHIIQNNTNIGKLLQKCLDRRFKLDDDKSKIEAIVYTNILEPNKNVYDIRARQAISTYEQQLKSEYANNSIQVDLSNLSPSELQLRETSYILPKLNAFSKKTIDDYDFKFADAYESYQESFTNKNSSTHKLSVITHAHDKETILEAVIRAYERVLKLLATNIKNIAKSNEDLVNLLKSPVSLTISGEEIVDSYNSNNISGMYQILNNKFKKRTFVNVCNALVNILSWSQSKDDTLYPERALIKMNQYLADWTRQDLFPLLTKDIFFSANLIKGLSHDCPIKNDLLIEVIKYIRELESDDSKASLLYSHDSNNSMPIYMHIKEFIDMHVESRNIVTIPSNKPGPNSTNNLSSPGTPGNFRSNNRYGNSNHYPKVEHAAASQIPIQVYEEFSKKLFQKEITAAHNIFIRFNNKAQLSIKKPYYAVKHPSQLCNNCFPENSSAASNPCTPMCFGTKCDRCLYYGHLKPFCLHTHDVSGNLINTPITNSK